MLTTRDPSRPKMQVPREKGLSEETLLLRRVKETQTKKAACSQFCTRNNRSRTRIDPAGVADKEMNSFEFHKTQSKTTIYKKALRFL
jgi:hypothetical protein